MARSARGRKCNAQPLRASVLEAQPCPAIATARGRVRWSTKESRTDAVFCPTSPSRLPAGRFAASVVGVEQPDLNPGSAIIDVWDVGTFDLELREVLDDHSELISGYFITSRRQWLEREASDHTMPYPENPFAGDFIGLKEHVMELMQVRTIRAWHYTRMTDAEVAVLMRGGINLSTLASVRTRLDAQVTAGTFPQDVADRLFADSPFQSEQCGSRSDKFWMVSHPLEIEDGGVELLLESWGGESAYFWQRDRELQELLKRIGRPRVLEIAMPLAHSRHGYAAADAVVATYGRLLGCRTDRKTFDLYTHKPLGPAHVLAIHTAGDPSFEWMGRGYPLGYVDIGLAAEERD